jgi:hypothetical protein
MNILKFNIKDIGAKKIDVSGIEGSENTIKISELNINSGESKIKPFNITVIPSLIAPTPVKVTYLPLSAGLGVSRHVNLTDYDYNSIRPRAVYQFCEICKFENSHSTIKKEDDTIIVCENCLHGYILVRNK